MSTYTLLQIVIITSYSVGIILAFHAIYHARSPQGAVAWILSLVLLPIPSIAFYLGLGTGRIRRRMKQVLPETSARHIMSLWQDHLGEQSRAEHSIANLTQIRACSGNRLQLLKNGMETYRSLLEAMEVARESIQLEFFIIKNDFVGDLLAECLMHKAREGVRVQVLYDEIGSRKLPFGFLYRLKKAGVEISPFFGQRFWVSSFLRLNYRNHRKLVIVDGNQAWMGGLNIGREYLGRESEENWRDTFIKLEGPVVAQAFLCFAQDWYRATRTDLSHGYKLPTSRVGSQQAMCIPSGPELAINAWQSTVLILAAEATSRLWIATPYLVPSDCIVQALHLAVLRGVDVRLLIPQRENNIISGLAMLNYIPELLRLGVRLWGYEAGFMHQKVLLCDEQFSCIGSANLDNRSLNLNYELNCLMNDREMNRAVADMLLADMAQSRELGFETWTQASVLKQLAARCCRLIAPVL